MRYRFTLEAEQELNDATDWYSRQRNGLGNDLKEEVKSAVRRICRKPESSALLRDKVRLYRIARFPYGIIFRVVDQFVEIIAVAHLHRRPDYWHDRLDPPNPEET